MKQMGPLLSWSLLQLEILINKQTGTIQCSKCDDRANTGGAPGTTPSRNLIDHRRLSGGGERERER